MNIDFSPLGDTIGQLEKSLRFASLEMAKNDANLFEQFRNSVMADSTRRNRGFEMNNKKVLVTAILLILARSALGIEVEPNNDSAHANKLGKENSGKLNRASDVDFFSIDSCVKNTQNVCAKYTATDESADSTHKAGTDVRRSEISLSFTCNNRSTTSIGGWFLGIHDANGELQDTYPVKPADCVISSTNLNPFAFKFSSVDSSNYFISVVSDCQIPVYSTMVDPKDPTKTIVNVNKFVTAATAKQTDIDAVKVEIVTAQKAIDNAKNDLNTATFSVINSNTYIQKLTDALAFVSDITSISSPTLTPATNISATNSTAKAIEIAGSAMQFSIYTYGQVLLTQNAAKDPAIATAIANADAAIATVTKQAEQATTNAINADAAVIAAKADLATAKAKNPQIPSEISDAISALDTANIIKKGADLTSKTSGTDYEKNKADLAKIAAENAQKAANDAKTAEENALADAKTKDTDAQSKLTDSMKALDDATKSLNDTVKANIDAANTAQNLSKRFDSACKDNNYNVGVYTIKDNPDDVTAALDTISTKPQKNLGLEQTGQIKTITGNDVYIVESDGTADIPLVFTCTAMAARQTNDWKLSIYNDANGLVSSTLINGSSCGTVFIGDKGGQSFKLPKGSPRYYLSVESACVSSTKNNCVVETAEYSILRDVDKVYSGRLTTANTKITATNADLKLTNCGLNNSASILVHAENVDLTTASKLTKLPVNIQIGGMACRILTPELSSKDAIIGSVADSSTIFDSGSTAKDSLNIGLTGCGVADNSKVTLTGSKLDLVNLNANAEASSVVIPIKVNIGDFHCETKEVFYITSGGAASSDISYSNTAPAPLTTNTSITTTPTDPVIAVLPTATNIGLSQTNKLKSAADIQAYYVDTGSTSTAGANFTFSCPDSNRFTNDWTLLIYDATKTLKDTQIINGSDCGTGKSGDSGLFNFSTLKNTARSYFVVKSACGIADTACVVDSSQYEINRVIPVQTPTPITATTTNTATTSTATTTVSPCFGSGCTTTTTVKPFFTSPK